MLISVVILMILSACQDSAAIYSNNSRTKKIESESNPAIWTENGIWSSILEDWIISSSNGNYRSAEIFN